MKFQFLLLAVLSMVFWGCRPQDQGTEFNIAEIEQRYADDIDLGLDQVEDPTEVLESVDVENSAQRISDTIVDAGEYPDACYDLDNYDVSDPEVAAMVAKIPQDQWCKLQKEVCKDPNAGNYVHEAYALKEFVDKEALQNGELRKFERRVDYVENNALCEVYCGYKFKPVDDYQEFSCDSSIQKEIIVGFAGDDRATLFVNGTKIRTTWGWKKWTERKITINNCGVIGFHVEDTHKSIVGFLAVIWEVDEDGKKGRKIWSSGENTKLKAYGPAHPTPGNNFWAAKNFDDTAPGWNDSAQCKSSVVRRWGSTHKYAYSQGAKWLWHDSHCDDLKQSFFRFKYVFGAAKKVYDPQCVGKDINNY